MRERIIINEVGLRECFQNLNKVYSVEDKLNLLDGLISSGLNSIQLCSFVSPKILPQMADAEKIYFSAPKLKDLFYSAFILNVKGFNRAVNCGFKKIETSISFDEKYGLTNTGMDEDDAFEEINKISDLAHSSGIKIRIGLQCVWGKRNKKINIHRIVNKIEKIIALDPHKICLADTAGLATPETVKKYLDVIIPLIKKKSIVMHFHQSRAGWKNNVKAAIEMGIREFDSSLGGTGGSPFLKNSKGNIPTEKLIRLIDELGFYTGINKSVLEKTLLKLNIIINKMPASTIV